MQIANGYVTTCPENKHMVYGITPAEAVIIKRMHNSYSNGSPLSDLVIVGEANEVDQYGKPLMIGEKKPFKRIIASMDNEGNPTMKPVADFEMVYTPSLKPRTQLEEINRLRRKYVGNVTENGKSVSAWESAFGSGAIVKLPDTFDEVSHVIGPVFTDGRPKTISNPEALIGEIESTTPLDEVMTPQPSAPTRRGRPPLVKQPETATV